MRHENTPKERRYTRMAQWANQFFTFAKYGFYEFWKEYDRQAKADKKQLIKGLTNGCNRCYTLNIMDAKIIKGIRKRLGFTQKQLAELIGVDQVSVNRWENNKRKPSKLALRQLERLRKK